MAIKMTEEEYKAIGIKLNNPEKEVRCPRCGKRLLYKKNWQFYFY